MAKICITGGGSRFRLRAGGATLTLGRQQLVQLQQLLLDGAAGNLDIGYSWLPGRECGILRERGIEWCNLFVRGEQGIPCLTLGNASLGRLAMRCAQLLHGRPAAQ